MKLGSQAFLSYRTKRAAEVKPLIDAQEVDEDARAAAAGKPSSSRRAPSGHGPTHLEAGRGQCAAPHR